MMLVVSLTFAVLLATATAQTTPNPLAEEWYPFQNPGEILPGGALTVPYILDIVGGFWTQYRLIDSYAYLCTDVLPELSEKIPEIGNMSDVWEPVCEEVVSARNAEEGFNATGFCDALVYLAEDVLSGPGVNYSTTTADIVGVPVIPDLTMPPMDNFTMPVPEGMAGLPVNLTMLLPLLDIVENVTRKLYQIDINDPLTICPQAHHFLEPSLPKLVYDFGTELLSYMVTTAVPTCDDLDGLLESLGINATSPLYSIAQEIEELLAKAMGYESQEDLCRNITDAMTHQTTEELVMKVMNNLFLILTNEDTCGVLAHDVIHVIDHIIMMVMPADNSTNTTFSITDDVIYQYTGFMDVEEACEAVDRAFSGCHSTGFDRDACGICVMSSADGVPSFLSSSHRDCVMKCPLDMDHGAIVNECGYCVLGGTGLPINEGKNVCNTCDEDTSCVGCDGEANSGKEYDNCNICAGNHTDCMIVVTIEPSAIPENMAYNIMVHGAGFHAEPSPICIFSRTSDSVEFNVTMDVRSPSMGYCLANLESAIYSVHVLFNTTRVIHSDNLEVYTPVTINGVSEDVFTLGSTVQYVLRFTAAAESSFTQAQELRLTPYLIFLDNDEEMPPVMGFIEGDTTLTFTLPPPNGSTQVIVSPSFNQIDLLPTASGEPFKITFYDPPPQLDMATLSFKPTGNILTLVFPEAVSIMDDVLPDCNRIFFTTVQDGEEERNLLGVGSQCYLTRNHDVLEIVLGRGDNLIRPGEIIIVRGDVIYGAGEYPSAAKETNITVSPGTSPMVSVVIRGATSVSSCGNVSLSARDSTGSASRAFTYLWMVNPADSTNLSDAVSGTTTADLNIDGNLLIEDVVYTFSVFATNFLGGTGGGNIEAVRIPYMVPDLTITPSPVDPGNVMLSESFYLHAQVTFYSDCEGAEPMETEYRWTVNNDDVMLDETTKNSRSLYVPAYSLPGDTSITFTVEILRGMNGSADPSSDVTIITHSSDPVAVIVGGRERNIGIGSGMVELDGSASRDPDQPGTGDLEFTWKCVQIPENILCMSAIDRSLFPSLEESESSSFSFNASHMAAGKTYEITLKVSSMYRESPETSVFIYALPGNSPQVLVSKPGEGPVLSTRTLALTANVQHTTSVDITWSIIGENIALDETDFTGSATNTELDDSTLSLLHIQPGVLRPGEAYIVLVIATDKQGQSGSSQMELVVASGVSACRGSLESGNTYTELDELTFTIDHCVTDEGAYPLTYQLLAADDEGNERSLTPADVESRIHIVGPPAMEGIENRTFVTRVCNSHASCSSFSIVTSVEMRAEIDSQALEDAIVSLETLKGDYLKAFINLNALSYVEDRLAQEVRRRRATETSDRANKQLMLLHSALSTSVLDTSAASTLIDACEGIAVDDLSQEDTDNFLEKLHALVSVFECHHGIPTYSATVVLNIIRQIESMTDDEDTVKMCRELTKSLTKASLGGLILGDSAAETSSEALTSTVYYAIPQGSFPSKSGEGAFYVDLGNDVAEMYGGYWNCDRPLCTGVNIQFDHFDDDIDPYTTDDEDRDNRASAILDIKLFDPSSCEELMVDSLNNPILINMTASAKKRNHDFKCYIWNENDKEWDSEGIETMKVGSDRVQCKVPRTGTYVILAKGRGSSNAVIIIVSIIGALLALTLIVAIAIVIRKKTMKDKGDSGNVATNDRSTAVATSMTSDAKQGDGSQEASTEYAYDFNMQNMASNVNC